VLLSHALGRYNGRVGASIFRSSGMVFLEYVHGHLHEKTPSFRYMKYLIGLFEI